MEFAGPAPQDRWKVLLPAILAIPALVCANRGSNLMAAAMANASFIGP